MATRFNYERAHAEWAVPEYVKLSEAVKELHREVIANAGGLTQRGASNAFNETALEARLVRALDKIPCEELAHAMKVIYGCGHWDSRETREVPYPRDGVGGYWKFEHLAKQSLIGRQYCYWKFEHLAKQSLIGRQYCWKERDEEFTDRYMDHEEGTSYTDKELVGLFAPRVTPEFTVVDVRCVNYRVTGYPGKGHPFVIGNAHFPKDGGMYIDVHQAGCAHCGFPYEDHVYDRVLILRIKDPVGDSLTPDQTARLKALGTEMKKHHVDGFVFAR